MIDHEHQPFIRAVIDDPTNDAPRLAYAEWLVRRSDPRGEFIRAQIEAYGLRSSGEWQHRRTEYQAADDRANSLLSMHYAQWTQFISPHNIGDPNVSLHPRFLHMPIWFFRGFPEVFRLTASTFLDCAATIVAAAPMRCLWLTNSKSMMRFLADCKQMNSIVELSLDKNNLDDSDVALIANSKNLKNLLSLSLSWNSITDNGVELLITDNLQGLLNVALTGNKCQNPVEDGVGHDLYTGQKFVDSIELPEFGKQLEAKHGDISWLHSQSRIYAFPLTPDWFSIANQNSRY